MKKLLFIVFNLAFISMAFSQEIIPAAKGVVYGETITSTGAFPIANLTKKMNGADKMDAKVTGKVIEVCEKKGCFMKLENAKGEPIMVKFKNYGFFVPSSLVGKTVVLDGFAKQELVSVEKLKHYAQDAKKSQSEIDKIKEAKEQITFEAKGVVVM